MSRFRKHVVGVLAAVTVAAVGLAAAPPASAMSWSCATRNTLATLYNRVGDAFDLAGDIEAANYWWGKADTVLEGAGC